MRSVQRQRAISPPTDIAREIAETAYMLLLDNWSAGKPIRMLTVTVSGLLKGDEVVDQISFFDTEVDNKKRDKDKKREETLDKIRQKYGGKSIVNAAVMDSDIGIYDRDEGEME